MVTLKIALLFLLTGITHDQYAMAQMLDGEAYGCVGSFCQEAAVSLQDTVYNRIDRGWCSGVQQCLESAYWGYRDAPEVPSNWAIDAAQSYQRQNGAILFAFSGADCDDLGLDRSAAIEAAGPFFFFDNKIELE